MKITKVVTMLIGMVLIVAFLVVGCKKKGEDAPSLHGAEGEGGGGVLTLPEVQQTSPSVCGDGVVDAGEGCDDGNVVAGDGCDENCVSEGPALCGDGNVDPGEGCDDGNVVPGDGCDENCLDETQPPPGEEIITFPEVKDLKAILPNNEPLLLVANKVEVVPAPTRISPYSGLRIVFDAAVPAGTDPEIRLELEGNTVADVTVTRDSDEIFSVQIDKYLHHNKIYILKVEKKRTDPPEFAELEVPIGNAGDFDGDGYSDIVVGAPNPIITLKGVAFLYLGNQNGTFLPSAVNADLSFHPAVTDTRFGRAVALGDLNGDGRADIAVGAPKERCVYVFHGRDKSNFPSNKKLYSSGSGAASKFCRINGIPSSFGSALAIGHLNGDGLAEIIIGELNSRGRFNENVNLQKSGSVHVFFGKPGGIPSKNLNATTPSDASATVYVRYKHVGSSVAAADVDGDGFDEIIIGAPGNNKNPAPNCVFGDVFIVNGARDLADTGFSFNLIDPSILRLQGAGCTGNDTDHFGISVAPMAIPEKDIVLIGAKEAAYKYEDNSGVEIILGTPLLGDPVVVGGLSDAIAIGSPEGSYVIRYDSEGNPLPFLSNQSQTSEFGWALSPAADLDGNGEKDFVIAEKNYMVGGLRYGAVHVYVSGSPAHMIEGSPFFVFGSSVAGGRIR